MALLAERHAGVFGETAAGVTLGGLRGCTPRRGAGALRRGRAVVTGDGLKTPEPVAGLLRPVEIEADVDAVLERLGAAA